LLPVGESVSAAVALANQRVRAAATIPTPASLKGPQFDHRTTIDRIVKERAHRRHRPERPCPKACHAGRRDRIELRANWASVRRTVEKPRLVNRGPQSQATRVIIPSSTPMSTTDPGKILTGVGLAGVPQRKKAAASL
jgi:hypothetical protein